MPHSCQHLVFLKHQVLYFLQFSSLLHPLGQTCSVLAYGCTRIRFFFVFFSASKPVISAMEERNCQNTGGDIFQRKMLTASCPHHDQVPFQFHQLFYHSRHQTAEDIHFSLYRHTTLSCPISQALLACTVSECSCP